MTDRVLLVEDDEALAQLIAEELAAQDLDVTAVTTVRAAQDELQRNPPALLVTDLRLPDGFGTALLDTLPQPRPAVVVVTAFGDVQQAVAALKRGADDFLTKPLDFDHFNLSIQRVLETRSMRATLNRLGAGSDYHGLYGRSRAMRVLYEQIEVMARGQGAVLILGESGTGKELVARALHHASARSKAPFLAVNCAGIPAELLESEFFGHTAGAFTGAGKARRGLLLEANGGTLLLDEIAEMPLALQARLLRALQDGHIRPLGQEREEQVDVRIIAATHGNLGDRVAEGNFREDLFYRLETFTLQVPPLRQRQEDIELLAARFLYRHGLALQRTVHGLTAAAARRLQEYPFPGNVRELENAMEHAATFSTDGWVDIVHLPQRIRQYRGESGDGLATGSDPVGQTGEIRQPSSQSVTGPGVDRDGEKGGDKDCADNAQAAIPASLTAELLGGAMLPTMDELQRRYVEYVLKSVGGNKRRAAALLGIGRRTLYRWLEPDD